MLSDGGNPGTRQSPAVGPGFPAGLGEALGLLLPELGHGTNGPHHDLEVEGWGLGFGLGCGEWFGDGLKADLG